MGALREKMIGEMKNVLPEGFMRIRHFGFLANALKNDCCLN
jgi:hypothetical protein